MSLERFDELLAERELNRAMLAELAGTSRSHLSQVLHNHPGRGGLTRKRLVKMEWTEPHPFAGQPILTWEMRHELGWDEAGGVKGIVPRRTFAGIKNSKLEIQNRGGAA